jgi:hypothetical protein
MNMRWLVVVAALGATTAMASPARGAAPALIQSIVTTQVASPPGLLAKAVLQIPDTLRTKMLAALARGDLAGAISLWELQMGRSAPKWLQAFQSAFSSDNQKAGPCIEVAKSVFEGFKRLGANPTYVRFTSTGTQWGDEFIAFELRAGEPRSTIQISTNAVHYVVRVGDRIYDAMTGPAGLVMSDYMRRLLSPGSISMQTVSQLP